MIISDDQARLAARQLTHSGASGPVTLPRISDELMKAAIDAVQAAPEVRQDRVDAARRHLDAGPVDSHDIACKIISRIVSDSLR
jgi:hypothetical protein